METRNSFISNCTEAVQVRKVASHRHSGVERESADSFGPDESLCREPDCRGTSIEYARLTEAWETNFVSLRLYFVHNRGRAYIVKSTAEQRWKIVDISNCQNFVKRDHFQA